jgi:hypothetical protein
MREDFGRRNKALRVSALVSLPKIENFMALKRRLILERQKICGF